MKKQQLKKPPFIATLGNTMRSIFLIFLLLLNVVGCSILNVSNGEIRAAEKKWHNSNITSYSYTLIVARFSWNVECEIRQEGIDVIVSNGKVIKFGTCNPDSDFAQLYGSIDRTFKTLYKTKSNRPPGFFVVFNTAYGYPESINLNSSIWRTDHRVQYYLSKFKVQELN